MKDVFLLVQIASMCASLICTKHWLLILIGGSKGVDYNFWQHQTISWLCTYVHIIYSCCLL